MTTLVALGAFAAGLLGALTGLGGGVVIVPDVGPGIRRRFSLCRSASLVSVIATSSGAAASYVREGYSNVRIGMFLEVGNDHRRLGRRRIDGGPADERDCRDLWRRVDPVSGRRQ